MAPPATSRPARGLIALLIVLVGLLAWAFWPGTANTVRLGLDLQGGTQVILVPKPVTTGAEITDEQLQQTVAIIRQRVDGLGVAEAEVTTQGTGNGAAIIVSVPGAEQDRVVDLVKRTALLDFRPVDTLLNPQPFDINAAPTPEPSASASASGSPTPSPTPSPTTTFVPGTSLVQSPDNSPVYQGKVFALDCTNPEAYTGGIPDDPGLWLGTCERTGGVKYNLEPAFIKGSNVTGATAGLPQNGVGSWVVSLEFDSEGAKALAEASTKLSALQDCGAGVSPCNAFAIVLDGVVVSAPRFNEPILGGQAQIEGNFTAQEANDLANVLKYGALPVTLDPVDITSVSPTVGNDQLRAGIIAGLLGLVLVMIYLLIYYRALGIVAVISLISAGAITYLMVVVFSKTIGLTLTLAGVAGAIVAIGITADSFIVYFERIRDEIREGRSLRQACESGWVRARRTLLAADFVSLLAAVVLYLLSVGSVRGFAFVLGLTTIIDILVAFWFTHPLVVLIGRTEWMQKGSRWTGLDADRVGGHSLGGGVVSKSRRRQNTDQKAVEVTSP
ncbi:MAG: protein translocase subunit SecD [Actinobacteria bacterium]|nr:MAG: protein translocase subunit SecD [Actinomycetota bacterium]